MIYLYKLQNCCDRHKYLHMSDVYITQQDAKHTKEVLVSMRDR
jgi:hypothetical protein